MKRLFKPILALTLTAGFYLSSIPPMVYVGAGITAIVVTQTSCGPNDLHKLHDTLNRAAKALNAAAKTNHSLYESGTYGAVGSPKAIAIRQKAATIIHDRNENLITALTIAKGLTEASFEQGKLAVLQALAQATTNVSTGNATIDLVIQSVVAIINEAVSLVQLFNAQDLHWILPEIQTWKITEVVNG